MMLMAQKMPELTDVVIEDPRWELLKLEDIAERAATAALDLVGVTGELVIMGCDDARIAELNIEFRDKPTPTNVLSWPAEELIAGDKPTQDELGDIAIAYETCAREALENHISIPDHVTHLIIHGCLHLLGYDHINDEDAEIMEGLEIKALANLGLDNPYKEHGAD